MGMISYELKDLQLWEPEFCAADYLTHSLLQQFHDTPVTGVKIVQSIDGTLKWSVDPVLVDLSRSRYRGIQIAENEHLLFKTRVYQGVVSFDESDVHFRLGNWEILVTSLRV